MTTNGKAVFKRAQRLDQESEVDFNSRDARERGAALQHSKQEEHDALVKAGEAINVKDAMRRCFTAGNAGTESLRGGFD